MFVVIPDVLTEAEVATLRTNAATEDFLDGRLTAAGRARNVKNNLQTDRRSERMSEAQDLITAALNRNSTFQTVAAPRRILPPRFNLYKEGMFYGDHVDNALMGDEGDKIRVDMSFTLFLSSPQDYDGGELVIKSGMGNSTYKLPAGQMVVYPTYYFHEVRPVTRGERLACVSWLQSMIREPARREIMLELAMISNMIQSRDARAAAAAQDMLDKVRKNLLRQWIDD
ncbi:Fe2+-dependent dioxygenase [Ferrovibrio xuzhouensis]|uniref:Fe2+-dependent dioxygenase n=1 Tax=Ferrovibrio xuzhouensis TaxID=1576914 RepID=A0ABV7VKG3_9PROT